MYVADVYGEYERLSGLGMVFRCPPGGSGQILVTYSRDCDGNVVELPQIMEAEHPNCYLSRTNEQVGRPTSLR